MFVDEDVIKRLEQHSDYSPTIRLFDHLEVTQPDLTIQTIRKALSEIGRNDICLLTTEAKDKTEISSPVLSPITHERHSRNSNKPKNLHDGLRTSASRAEIRADITDSCNDDVLLKDVMTPGSELLQTMADKLNRELPAVKNWKNLASQLEIPVDVRREFADESTGEKRRSPTKEVMEWVAARFPTPLYMMW
ncbi:hypothetical protein OS493_027980 [Desmophyllum pertusum]|uniref:Death domain-containing protein n=1 Tax=Desmophyllum pertusum TaxID=174260 RepID=A0A9W9Y9D4_9CNID|nr:hypothetical protein OS493_027980 [Desmophyllum pertusum]